MPIEISRKQAQYIREANHRWNIKMGATQSGKTYLDTRYLIPSRLLERKGKDGLNFIVGVTKETIERNVLSKMRTIWGEHKVSEINSKNRATLFGEMVYCIGAKDKGQAAAFRGATAKYLYIDEFPDISEEVFSIFSSRLSTPYSCADMTGNPKDPKHWSEEFIASDKDIYFQRYTLYDNPFLDLNTIQNIERDYAGTVYFDRYVLGLPKRAEGLVFVDFADHTEKYIVDKKDVPKRFKTIGVGYDLGGNISNFALMASGITNNNEVYALRAKEIFPDDLKLEDVEKAAIDFIESVEKDYNAKAQPGTAQHIINKVRSCYVDDNYYTTVNSLNKWRYIFDTASHIKATMPLEDRPLMLSKLMAQGKFKLVKGECEPLIEQLQNAVFDDKSEKAIILDNGSYNIDCIDAFFYSIADDYLYLID